MAGRAALAALSVAACVAASALADLKSACNALSLPHVYRHQTCLVLHNAAKVYWVEAVDACDDIAPGEDSAPGHLWYPTEPDVVMELLTDTGASSGYTHAGVYKVDHSVSDDEFGWYYVANSSRVGIAELVPAFWPWWWNQPNDADDPWVLHRAVFIKFDSAAGTATRWDISDDDTYTPHTAYKLCQYDKRAGVAMNRFVALDGHVPVAAATLKTEVGVRRQRLMCIMACVNEWGPALCRAVAHNRDSGDCVHSLALAGDIDKWEVDTHGGKWQVSSLDRDM